MAEARTPTTVVKRRARKEGAVYQRKDGMWVAAVNLGWGLNKKGERVRRRRVVYAKTQGAVIEKLNRVKRDHEKVGDTLPTASTTVEEWLTYWLRDMVRRKVKPKTLATYRSHIEQHIIPALGRKKLDKLTTADVRELHRYVERKGLSSTTALHAHRILGTALQAAMRDDLITRNVVTLTDAPRRAVSIREKGLSVEHAKKVLRAAKDDRLSSRWMAAFFTGARQGELLGLRWRYVDLEAGTVDLAWSLQRVPYSHGCGEDEPSHRADRCPERKLDIPAGYEYEVLDGNLTLMRPKTKGSKRIVALAQPLWRSLQARQLDVMVERDAYTVDHDLVWCRKDGRPIDGRQDWKQWKALLATAGVPEVTLHEARNTTASLLREAGVDDTTAAQILGHSDVLTTRAYQRKDVGFQVDAMAKLEGLLALDH